MTLTIGTLAEVYMPDYVALVSKPERTAQMKSVRHRNVTFVSTLAHELRQPLSALLTAVESFGLAPDRATEIMKRQISQMERLIDDLLDETRWSCGKVAIRKQRLDIREIVAATVRDVTAAVAKRGQQLVAAFASEPLWADVDPQRLQQVLSNLLSNAVNYTDPGGRIWVSADRGAATVTLRVRDTGCGIAPEALPHVFDLFSQVRPFEAGGLGIGLSVVREIVMLHEGRIEARSEGLGSGSEFVVTLPLAAPANAQNVLRPSPPVGDQGAGCPSLQGRATRPSFSGQIGV